jgi:predicted DCC family thiol-disulfide oxidoreductase YuxK
MNPFKTIMFYDGGCPLCNREVKHYQRLDIAQRIEWVDISRDMNLLEAFGVAFETAMERLHVLYRDGRLLTGAYAFAAIWSELPYYRTLAAVMRFPSALTMLDKLYSSFARWRFQRRCREGSCALPSSSGVSEA